jgi:general secretion pathway protein A
VIIIIDEAQNLSMKTLEEVRMLSNLESQKNHLIQIILVGQPELKYKLRKKELEQFAQRITVHCHLEALNEKEVKGYIQYRLRVAGCKRGNLFSDDAISAVAKISKGIPRMINIICDSALVYAFADNKDIINKSIIDDVVRERAAGGIFFDDESIEKLNKEDVDREAKKDIKSEQTIVETLYSNEKMIRIEERMQKYEDNIKMLHEEISGLKNLYNERDEIIIELFKLLHTSMKGRYFLLKGAEAQRESSTKTSANTNENNSSELN